MTSWFKTYLTTDYLWTPVASGKFELLYLVVPICILAIVVGSRLILRFKGGRPPIYKSFDRQWFWGLFSLSLLGLFIYFSRIQNLPIFGTRLISYLWLLLIAGYLGYLFWYFKKKIPDELSKFYEKKRKNKYLKNKE